MCIFNLDFCTVTSRGSIFVSHDLLQNIPLEKLRDFAEALKENTNLEKLHMANTRATDRVAKVCITSKCMGGTICSYCKGIL